MKKTLFYLCFAVVLGCVTMLTTSCSEKAKALNNLEDLAKDVQKNGDSYGVSEWMDIFNQYQAITAVIEKHSAEYSQNQRNRINKAKSNIKQAAWHAAKTKWDAFPEFIKKPVFELYHSLFDEAQEETELKE